MLYLCQNSYLSLTGDVVALYISTDFKLSFKYKTNAPPVLFFFLCFCILVLQSPSDQIVSTKFLICLLWQIFKVNYSKQNKALGLNLYKNYFSPRSYIDVRLLDYIQNVVLFDTPFDSEDDIRVLLCLWNKDAGEKKVKKQDFFFQLSSTIPVDAELIINLFQQQNNPVKGWGY